MEYADEVTHYKAMCKALQESSQMVLSIVQGRVDHLEKEIERLQISKSTEYVWFDVKDKLPKEKENCLVIVRYQDRHRKLPNPRMGYLKIWSDGPFWVVPKFDSEELYKFEVVYWSYMPKIPKRFEQI